MILRKITHATVMLAVAAMLAACSSKFDGPVLTGRVGAATNEGQALYAKARKADEAGKTGRAIRLYDKTATRYPFLPEAAKARYRQAELLDREGEAEEAFDAYDLFLAGFPADDLYKDALRRQDEIAHKAADGGLKSSFLGIKSRIPLETCVKMLGKVAGHAPMSRTAAKARFTIGELYQAKGKPKEAIEGYRTLVREQPDSAEAPEALFRVGLTLLEDAERGNQNQANLDLAREAFNDYLMQYPGHSRNGQARSMLASLDKRDQDRSLEIAEFYLKTGRTEAAKVYYRLIVKRGESGTATARAQARLKELGE